MWSWLHQITNNVFHVFHILRAGHIILQGTPFLMFLHIVSHNFRSKAYLSADVFLLPTFYLGTKLPKTLWWMKHMRLIVLLNIVIACLSLVIRIENIDG